MSIIKSDIQKDQAQNIKAVSENQVNNKPRAQKS